MGAMGTTTGTNRLALVAVLLAGAPLMACTGPTNAGAPAVDEPAPVLKKSLHVLESPMADQAVVEDDRVVFPYADNEELLERSPGAGLVSGYGSATVFLRKVVSVARDGADVVVMTEPAGLPDAIESGTLHLDMDLTDPGDLSLTDLGGSVGGKIDITGLRLVKRSDGNGKEAGGFEIILTPTGHLRFAPHLSGSFEIDGAKLKKASLIAQADVDEQLSVAPGV